MSSDNIDNSLRVFRPKEQVIILNIAYYNMIKNDYYYN